MQFTEPEGLLLCLQVPATCSYPELDWSSPCSHPTTWISILILSFQVVSFPQVSPPKPCMQLSSPPYVLHAPPISFSLFSTWNIWLGVQIIKLLTIQFSPLPCYLIPLRPKILFSTLFSNTLSLLSSLNVSYKISKSFKTTGKIIDVYILIFIFLDSKLEDKRFCTKW